MESHWLDAFKASGEALIQSDRDTADKSNVIFTLNKHQDLQSSPFLCHFLLPPLISYLRRITECLLQPRLNELKQNREGSINIIIPLLSNRWCYIFRIFGDYKTGFPINIIRARTDMSRKFTHSKLF